MSPSAFRLLPARISRKRASLAAARRAVQLAPNDGTSYLMLAQALFACWPLRSRAAEAAAQRAVELLPGDADALTLLGTIVWVRSNGNKAARHYADALAIDPHHANALLGLARASPNAAYTAVLARTAGRDAPHATNSMGVLVTTARIRTIAITLLALSPLALLASYLARPAGYAIATLAPLLAALVLAGLIAKEAGPRIARRWAEGRATGWLLDRGIAAGRPIARVRELLVGVAVGVLMFFMSLALISVGGGLGSSVPEWRLVTSVSESGEVTREARRVEGPAEQQEWVQYALIVVVVGFTHLLVIPLFQGQPLRKELDYEVLASDA